MELPIDHFRLLGVSPASGTEEVLRFLQLRLDRTPEEGFTPEVMDQRTELLRRSADLLCDKDLREKYETALLGGASGLEFSSNREVAGLILLWEADISYEAFKLARKSLQPPQAPALGSGRESDLTLLAALSCRDAALQEQEQRHYLSAAELLEEGIHLLQRMGKLGEYRQNLEKELELLLPYRILDLLSRDLSDQKSHQDGLNLLDSFVLRRGGIEGKNRFSSENDLSQVDFELFFKQIRKFLTVQEQIDIFSHWYKNGSNDAGFLFAISLIASGFSRRKPGALQKARKQLKRLDLEGLDVMPLIGCIDLLLADVKHAEENFANSSDNQLKDWLNNYPGDSLAALCDYSRNWLRRDVLPGFRDIDVDTVDLEAWFADRDVQDYVEKIEKKGALGIAKAGFSFISGLSSEKQEELSSNTLSDKRADINLDELNELKLNQVERSLFADKLVENYEKLILNFKKPVFQLVYKASNLVKKKVVLKTFIFLALFLTGGLIGWISIREQLQNDEVTKSKTINEKELDIKKPLETKKSLETDAKLEQSNELSLNILTDEFPSEDQILNLIQVWLKGKSIILSGGDSSYLSIVARPSLVKIVNQQRKEDKEKGGIQIINANVKSLKIQEQTNKRIEVNVTISYKDQRKKESGELLSETVVPSLNVKYIIGRKKAQWKLLDFSSRT